MTSGGARLLELARRGSLAFLCFCIFCPYLVERVSAPSLVIVGTVWLYGVVRVLQHERPTAGSGIWIAVPIVALAVAYGVNSAPIVLRDHLGGTPSVLTQYLLVLPVALVGGRVAARDPRILSFLRYYVALALVNAVLALAERELGRPIFPGNTVPTDFSTNGTGVGTALTDGGAVRGIVASEHPLVLGMLLLAAVPMVFRLRGPRMATAVSVVLAAGIWATDSSGPLALAVVAIGISLFAARRTTPISRAARKAVRVAWLLFIATFTVAAVAIWQPLVNSYSSVSESTQYRFALYSLIPRILSTRLFGYGLTDVPSGQLMIDRTGRALDASVSVDSELVLLAIQVGAIGVLLFVVVATLSIEGALRSSGPLCGALLAVTGSGMVLALHVWPAAGSMWAFLIGAVLGALRGGSDSLLQTDDQVRPARADSNRPVLIR